MATKTPTRISLRVYPVGFGDCFLLGFHYAAKDVRYVLVDFGSTELTKGRMPRSKVFNEYMRKVADDVKARCKADAKNGRLHAVVATHRHADHINGFATKSKSSDPDLAGDVIASLRPRFVLQPWTEDPRLKPDALSPAEAVDVGGARGFAASLAGMQSAAEGIVQEIDRFDRNDKKKRVMLGADDEVAGATPEAAASRRRARTAYVGTVRFLGEDAIKNRSAVENLMAMGKAGKPLYLHADQKPDIGLSGVQTHVLGPPTLKQSKAIRKQREEDEIEFWMLLGATSNRFTSGAGRPFSGRGCVEGSEVPDRARWLRDHLRAARAEMLLGIVRILDKQMNNTSLILVFEVGKARLLFPGDAQIENWQYALEKEEYRQLLAGTTLYKVGHHGSRNATPKKGLWELFENRSNKTKDADRMWSILSTMAGKHGTTEATKVPRSALVEALQQKSNHRSTQKFTRKEVDSRDFEIDPKTGRVTAVDKPKAAHAAKPHERTP